MIHYTFIILIFSVSKYHFYPPKYYKAMGINYIKNVKVKKLQSAGKKSYLYLENDQKIPFHQALLATGSSKAKKIFKTVSYTHLTLPTTPYV